MAGALASLRLFDKTIPIFFHDSEDQQGAAHRPLIIFTHHFGGSENSSQRHVSLLNQMGFDCVTFAFSWHGPNPRHTLPLKLFDQWSHEIDQVIFQIDNDKLVEPQVPLQPRKKIIYSFSGPCASALQAIARRLNNGCRDITGLICDSGPFINPEYCVGQMIRQIFGIKMPTTYKMTLKAMTALWGRRHREKILSAVASIAASDPAFPLLSIRGLQDTIVPPVQIAPVFENQNLRNFTILELDAGHLTGLRDQPETYKKALAEFLSPWL